MPGTDASTPYNFHGKQGYEFELLVSFGMTPLQALTAATREPPAGFCAKMARSAVSRRGNWRISSHSRTTRAKNIQTMCDCQFVMKDGKVYKRANA